MTQKPGSTSPAATPAPAQSNTLFGIDSRVVGSIFALLATIVLGAIGYWVSRVDHSTEKVSDRVTALGDKLDDRVTGVEKGLVEVKTKVENIEKSQAEMKQSITGMQDDLKFIIQNLPKK